MTTAPRPVSSGYEKDAQILNTNLRNCLEILLGNPRALDTDSRTTVGAFPHICCATIEGDRGTANPGEAIGYDVGGW